jgi:hypothetical protein
MNGLCLELIRPTSARLPEPANQPALLRANAHHLPACGMNIEANISHEADTT